VASVDGRFLYDPAQPGTGGLTARGMQSDCLSLIFSGTYRSSPILSLNHLFRGKHDSKLGNTTPDLYNEGPMAD
jgi:hypothetical protein